MNWIFLSEFHVMYSIAAGSNLNFVSITQPRC